MGLPAGRRSPRGDTRGPLVVFEAADVPCVLSLTHMLVLLVLSCLMYWPTLPWSQTVRDEAHGLV